MEYMETFKEQVMNSSSKFKIAASVAAIAIFGLIFAFVSIVVFDGLSIGRGRNYIVVGEDRVLCFATFVGERPKETFESSHNGAEPDYVVDFFFDLDRISEDSINEFFSVLADDYGYWKYLVDSTRDDYGNWRHRTDMALRLSENDSGRSARVTILRNDFSDAWIVTYQSYPDWGRLATGLEVAEEYLQNAYGFSLRELVNSTKGMVGGMMYEDFEVALAEKMQPHDADFDHGAFWQRLDKIKEGQRSY